MATNPKHTSPIRLGHFDFLDPGTLFLIDPKPAPDSPVAKKPRLWIDESHESISPESSASLFDDMQLLSSPPPPSSISPSTSDPKPATGHRRKASAVSMDGHEYAEYRAKREKNNAAVKKSRAKAKERRIEIEETVKILMVENERLKERVKELEMAVEIEKKKRALFDAIWKSVEEDGPSTSALDDDSCDSSDQ